MTDTNLLTPEWSHMVSGSDISEGPLDITITPNEAQRADLAKRLDIVSLDTLEAHLHFAQEQGSPTVHVTGTLTADITQNCVVSMEPVKTHIEENFESWFIDEEQTVPLARARKEKLLQKGQTEVPMLEERDDPETMIDGEIDAGELVAQNLSLSINPYIRAEGVEFESGDDPADKSSLSFRNPFAALKDWRGKGE